MSQLNALNFSDKELESAEYIIGNLDDRGYLAIEPIVISDKMGLSEQKILSLIDEIKKLILQVLVLEIYKNVYYRN